MSGAAPDSIMDFSASINPLGLSAKAAAAIRKNLKLATPYPDPESVALREALSGFHGLSPREILPGNGSTEFIHLIPRVYRLKRALVVEPAFGEYRASLTLSGCRVDSFILREEEGFALNPGRLLKSLKKGYDALYISNPANPTGAFIEKEILLDAARECRRRGMVFIADEAFADFCEEGSIKKEAVSLKDCVVLRSMTKFFSMAGLRLGFIIAESNTVKRFSRVMPPWSINTLAAIACVESLKDSVYIDRTLKWLAKERAFLLKGLNGIEGLKAGEGVANFIMVRIVAGGLMGGLTASALAKTLFKKGILIRDLSAFRGLGPGYFRVAVKKRKENEILLSALREAVEVQEVRGRSK